ncbi:MAG: response regulator [Proteobacteria bacterium]|nr:response regulator [Pseudomonadota bacterium]
MVTILIVDDESHIRKVIGGILKKKGYDIIEAQNGVEGLNLFEQADVVITDIHMPKIDGLEFIEKIRKRTDRNVPIIILTAYSTTEVAIKAIKLGAFDYIKKPFEKEELIGSVEKAVKTIEKEKKDFIAGKSDFAIPIMKGEKGGKILKQIEKIADLNVNVILTGETGTGKSMLASYIHNISNRSEKPLIKINCGAIPKDLIESELFGHKKGAFTGAYETKPGKFRLADGGTVFLDEIAEIPLNSQAKLLYVIQEREVQMIGGGKEGKVDVRIISATNRDIENLVERGEFREDLYYRISTIHLHLPPLRERIDEFGEIVDFLMEGIRDKYGIEEKVIDNNVMGKLVKYRWPGNIRELQNVLERFVLLGELKLGKAVANTEFNLNAVQVETIRRALAVSKNNVRKAAELLGISRRTLYNKLKELDIEIN